MDTVVGPCRYQKVASLPYALNNRKIIVKGLLHHMLLITLLNVNYLWAAPPGASQRPF